MPRRKPTLAIVETDSDTAARWQRKFTHAGFDVVGNYPGAELAWSQLRPAPPAALVLNWELPPGPNGDWLLKHFTQHQLPTRILVVTAHDTAERQTQALTHGAHGLVTLPVNLAALVEHLRALLGGQFPLATHNGEFLRKLVCASPCAAWQQLSPQQQRIVELSAQGMGNKEIGSVMARSKGTVEEQKRRIFTKLGTRDIKHVIARCAEALRPLALSMSL